MPRSQDRPAPRPSSRARRDKAPLEPAAPIERQIRVVIQAIKDGMRTPGMKDEFLALDTRKGELAAEVKRTHEPAPRLHPRLADIYGHRVERLRDSLNAESTRAEAAEALRNLIEEIRLVPEGDHLEIELAGILALTAANKKPVTMDRDGLPVTLAAGTRNQLSRTVVRWRSPVVSTNQGSATAYAECSSLGRRAETRLT